MIRSLPYYRGDDRRPLGSGRPARAPPDPSRRTISRAALPSRLRPRRSDPCRQGIDARQEHEAPTPLRSRARHHGRRAGPGARRPREGFADRPARHEPLRPAARSRSPRAPRTRRADRGSPGRGRALLHLQLDHGPRHEGRRSRESSRHRAGPTESARGRAPRRQLARGGLELVRRALSSPHPPRHDHGRAGRISERRARPRLRSHRGAHARLEAEHGVGGHGASLGGALAEHADAGHGARLSRRLPHRGHEPLGGARHHTPLRVDRRALSGWATARAGPRAPRDPGRALPPRGIRARLPQVEIAALRRRPGPRHRCRALQALRDLSRPHRRGAPAGAATFPLAQAALRVRARSPSHGPALRRPRDTPGPRARRAPRAPRDVLAPGSRAVRARAPALPALLMSLEALVGRRLVLGLPGPDLTDEDIRLFRETQAGGLILYRRNFETPERLARLVDGLESALGRRLLVATDHEGGRIIMLGRGVTIFPDGLAAGTAGEVTFAHRQGLFEGRELRRLGVDLNFAPVLDVLTERYSPNIGIRSYGKDPELVSRLGAARIQGMQAAGISACAKHFPGKGHAPVDAHLGLPVIDSDWSEMHATHLPPFLAAMEAGVDAIMTSHPLYPRLDPAPRMPATFSRLIVEEYLRGEVGYRGVIVSDDLEMGAIGELCPIGEATVRAAAAGHDLLLVCHTPERQRSEEHTSELQSHHDLVCRLLLEK